MHYLDTSVLIAAITTEATTPTVLAWLGRQPPDSLAISAWTITELHSALALKQRTGQIDATERQIAQTSFDTLLRAKLVMMDITDERFHESATLIDRAANLRAGDPSIILTELLELPYATVTRSMHPPGT